MNPRQMVGLRKAVESAMAQGGAPAGAPDPGEGPESAEEMLVQCPECGCKFDPSAVGDAPVGHDAPPMPPAEGAPE